MISGLGGSSSCSTELSCQLGRLIIGQGEGCTHYPIIVALYAMAQLFCERGGEGKGGLIATRVRRVGSQWMEAPNKKPVTLPKLGFCGGGGKWPVWQEESRSLSLTTSFKGNINSFYLSLSSLFSQVLTFN